MSVWHKRYLSECNKSGYELTLVKPATTMLCCSKALTFKPLLTAKPTMYFRYFQYSLVNVVFDDPHVWLIWMRCRPKEGSFVLGYFWCGEKAGREGLIQLHLLYCYLNRLCNTVSMYCKYVLPKQQFK